MKIITSLALILITLTGFGQEEQKFTLIYQKGKVGILDLNGDTILQPVYKEIVAESTKKRNAVFQNYGILTVDDGKMLRAFNFSTKEWVGPPFRSSENASKYELYILDDGKKHLMAFENEKIIDILEGGVDNFVLDICYDGHYAIAGINGKYGIFCMEKRHVPFRQWIVPCNQKRITAITTIDDEDRPHKEFTIIDENGKQSKYFSNPN